MIVKEINRKHIESTINQANDNALQIMQGKQSEVIYRLLILLCYFGYAYTAC